MKVETKHEAVVTPTEVRAWLLRQLGIGGSDEGLSITLKLRDIRTSAGSDGLDLDAVDHITVRWQQSKETNKVMR